MITHLMPNAFKLPNPMCHHFWHFLTILGSQTDAGSTLVSTEDVHTQKIEDIFWIDEESHIYERFFNCLNNTYRLPQDQR